jgi:hypothetical protein
MELSFSTRYRSQVTSIIIQELNGLISQLNSQSEVAKKVKIKSIEDDRKAAHRSCI